MSENAVSTGIMSTASIITTIIIITAAFTVAVSIGATIQDNGNNLVEQLNLEVDVIGTGDIQAGNESYYIYVKNVGADTIRSYTFIDIVIDGDYYVYGSSDVGQYRWSASILNDGNTNNQWDVHETVAILLTRPTGDGIESGSHRLVLSITGASEDFLFSI